MHGSFISPTIMLAISLKGIDMKKRKQQVNTSGGIFPFIIIAGFITLAIYAWNDHIDQTLVDTDNNAQNGIVSLLEAAEVTPVQSFRQRQADGLQAAYSLTEDDISAPRNLW